MMGIWRTVWKSDCGQLLLILADGLAQYGRQRPHNGVGLSLRIGPSRGGRSVFAQHVARAALTHGAHPVELVAWLVMFHPSF